MRKRRLKDRRIKRFVYREDPATTVRLAREKASAEAEMWAFENLPPVMQQHAVRSALGLKCVQLRDDFEGIKRRFLVPGAQVAQMMADAMPALQEALIRKFAKEYEAQWSRPYPHTAAGVPVLRFTPAKGSPP